MTSNAPFSDQRKFNANNNNQNVVGISNSPFTDQRKEQGGGGGGGDGNVIYDPLSNEFRYADGGGGEPIITSWNNSTAPLTIQNDGGGLIFNASNDTATLRGDNLLSLTSQLGNINVFTASPTGEVSLQNQSGEIILNGDITMLSGNDINFNIEDTFLCVNNSSTAGNLFRWINQVNTVNVGEWRMFRTSTGDEQLIADNINLISFAGNDSAIENIPELRLCQTLNGLDVIKILNSPSNIGDVLTFNGNGNGASGSGKECEWLPQSGSGAGVTYDPNTNSLISNSNTIEQIENLTLLSSANDNAILFNDDLTTSSLTLVSQGTAGVAHVVSLESDSLQGRSLIECRSNNNPGIGGIRDQINIEVDDAQGTEYIGLYDLETALGLKSGIFLSNAGAGTQTDVVKFQNINSVQFVARQVNSSVTACSLGLSKGALSTDPIRYYAYTEPNNIGGGNDITGHTPTIISGSGAQADPWIIQYTDSNNIQGLDITYETDNSILVLSDPFLPPAQQVISTTSVVPGRTVLIDDVLINSINSEESVIGLSNVIFPPPPSLKLVGNDPPLVLFPNPQTGLTNWFTGASFRATIAGTINELDNNDDLTCVVYSNRGQPSQNILNTFTLNLETVSGASGLGWKWDINFTCRSINNGNILGVLATNSTFNYSNDSFQEPAPEGFIVSNVNSSFDTNVTQYLDFTFSFAQGGNSLTTNLLLIERIY